MNVWAALEGAMQDTGDRAVVQRATLRRVAQFARPHSRTIGFYLALSTALAGLTVLSPVLAGRAVDAIVESHDRHRVTVLAIYIAIVAVAEAGVGLLERVQSSRLGENLILDLRRNVFGHVQKMPIAFFTRTHTGALVSRLNNDVIGAQRAFTSGLAGVVTNVIALVLTLVLMLSLSWQITLLSLLLLPMFLIPARRVGKKVGVLVREGTGHDAAMNTQMTERFSAPGATLVKLFGQPEQEEIEFGARAARVRDIGVRSAVAMEVFFRALGLVSSLALALVYGLGGSFALDGKLDPGTVVTLGLLLTRLYGPLTALATARVDVIAALVSFERVFEIMDIDPLIKAPNAPTPVPPGPLSIEIDHATFTYPSAAQVSIASLEEVTRLDDKPNDVVLHDVSMTVEPGQLVALVGSSGAGKSTLASLVPRLYDVDEGAVRIGGVDVRELSFADIRRAVGVVTQDGHLWHDTIGNNLRYAAPDATDEEIWEALRAARLDALIRSLPDALDTLVGERGYRLSGGERQRLTIARLLLAKPRVVILDEATAHLDAQSEHAVQEALAVALEGRTSIVIAHRLSTIRAADQILVMEAGRIVERGTHEELLAAGGRYRDLLRTQLAGHREDEVGTAP